MNNEYLKTLNLINSPLTSKIIKIALRKKLEQIPLFWVNIEAIAFKRETKPGNNKETQNQLNKDLITGADKYTLFDIKDRIEQGHTILQGYTTDWVKNDDCKFSQIVWLDFDNNTNVKKKWTLTEVVDFLRKINLKPWIGYHTFSHSPDNKYEKFRIGIAFDYPLNPECFSFIYKILLAIFPEADPACKNIARKIYGSDKSVKYFDPLAINELQNLFTSINLLFGSIESKATRKRYLDAFCARTEIKKSSSSTPNIYIDANIDYLQNNAEKSCYDLRSACETPVYYLLYNIESQKTRVPLDETYIPHSFDPTKLEPEKNKDSSDKRLHIFRSGENPRHLISIGIGDAKKRTTSKTKKTTIRRYEKAADGKQYNLEALIQELDILQKIRAGKYQLGRNELCELVQLLYPFIGAQKFINEAINNICDCFEMTHTAEFYQQNMAEFFDWCDRVEYPIKNFANCQTPEFRLLEDELSASNFLNIYLNLKARKLFVPQNRPAELIPIDHDMQHRFIPQLKAALNKENPYLSVFGAYLGGGKTLELTRFDYTELAQEQKIYIATTNHGNKRELYKRFRKMQQEGINKNLSIKIASRRPNLPTLNEQLEYESLMAIGAVEHAHNLYTRSVKGAFGLKEYDPCRKFLNRLDELRGADISICTHDYLLVMLSSGRLPENSILIFDEDLLMSLQKKVKTVGSNVLDQLAATLKNTALYSQMYEAIVDKLNTRIQEIDRYRNRLEEVILFENEAELTEAEISTILHYLVTFTDSSTRENFKDVAAVMSAQGFVLGKKGNELVLYLVNSWKLPPKHKYISLSATANETLYRRLAENSEIQDFTFSTYPNNIALEGDIYQVVDRNYSRSSLIKQSVESGYLDGFTEFVKNNADLENSVTITLKENHVQQYFRDRGFKVSPLVLGAAEGSDNLKGKTVIVVGTFSMPSAKYVSLAGCLGYRGKGDFQHNQKCFYNGVNFSYSTFTDPFLREIHFWIVDSALTQAVGRARSAREKTGNVYVASGFPVKFGTYIKKNQILNEDRFELQIQNGILGYKEITHDQYAAIFNDSTKAEDSPRTIKFTTW